MRVTPGVTCPSPVAKPSWRQGRVSTAGGLAIGVDEASGGDAAPIVFLHGVGSDKSVWAPQVEHFGHSRRALAFDYPGYGESDPAPPGTTRDDFAAAMLVAMDALGIRDAHICGLSLGGVIAIAMHERSPDRCRSLILADTFAVHPDGQAIYDRSVAASESMTELAAARTPALLAPGASEALHQEVRETMARIDPDAFRIGAKAVWLATSATASARLACRRWCWSATRTRSLRHSCPRTSPTGRRAELHILAGAGHLTISNDPEISTRCRKLYRGVRDRRMKIACIGGGRPAFTSRSR